MSKKRFKFYAIAEAEHSFEVEAESLEKALDDAQGVCASTPGYLIEYVQAHLTEVTTEGEGRSWSYEDGEFVEASSGQPTTVVQHVASSPR
jgi:hypothetical protein